jgi:VWFA-related protein
MLKRLIPILVFAAAASAFPQSLTEKIDVSLVNVDVTVTSHGAPARGLTRDDFEILEDGVPQKVTNFYAIENAPDKSASVPSLAAIPSVRIAPAPTDEQFRRKVLVILDNRHMSPHNRDVALQKLETFIKDRFDSGAYDWSIAMVGQRAVMLLPMTSDKAKIHAALAEVRGVAAGRSVRQAFGPDDALARTAQDAIASVMMHPPTTHGGTLGTIMAQSDRLEASFDAGTTYLAIRDVVRSFANTPGRKIILLFSGGFIDDENALVSTDPSLSTHYNATISNVRDQLVREANASNVSISVVNVEGLTPTNAGADMGHLDLDPAHFDSNVPGFFFSNTSPAALYWIARQTGGTSYNGNFIDRSLRDFDVSTANYYSLAYRPPHGDDRRYHPITVRLKKPGRYQLTYRNGYSSLPIDLQLERAMTSSLAVEMQPSSIPLNVTAGKPVAGSTADSLLVPINTAVSAKELQFLPAADGSVARVDVFVSLFSGDTGHLLGTFRTTREAHAKPGTEREGDFIEHRSLRLRKGVPYRVVVAVHDQVSDAVGIKSQLVRF